MSVRSQFTDHDLDLIREATRQAERHTGGELVCVIVDRCDTYPDAVWQAATMGAVGGAVFAALGSSLGDIWALSLPTWILVPPFAGAAVALTAVGLIRPARRWLVSPEVLSAQVDRRAAVAFLDEEIFDTRDRTGVLLFVALYEHQIRILTDRGVDEAVPQSAWQPIVDRLTSELRRGRKSEAIAAAIRACGDLLSSHGLTQRAEDENELADEPRLLDD